MSVIEAPTPARTEVTTRDVLHRAADLLEEFGWCQGAAARDADGHSYNCNEFVDENRHFAAYCHNGALWQAAIDLGVSNDFWLLMEGLGLGEAIWWNDQHGRTKAEVVARLRQAAENA